MRVLLIKTSSMGDIIHTLPALTDAANHYPTIQFDWVVEENFAAIPNWHPSVNQVIPIAIRRWRKNKLARETYREINSLRKKLREQSYDLIIDAQGLFKTIWISWLAKGPVSGLDRHSAREPLTSIFYRHRHAASWKVHAVTRVRNLFSQALHYELPNSIPNYGIDRHKFVTNDEQPYLLFLHGTTWDTKHWPEDYWKKLTLLAVENGFRVKLPWSNETELTRAKRIAENCQQAEILPRMNLSEIAAQLAKAKAIVSVDTGLGHLAAALDVPTVSLYGPTDAELTGTMGHSQIHLSAKFPCAPCFNRTCTYQGSENKIITPACFSTVTPEMVWEVLQKF